MQFCLKYIYYISYSTVIEQTESGSNAILKLQLRRPFNLITPRHQGFCLSLLHIHNCSLSFQNIFFYVTSNKQCVLKAVVWLLCVSHSSALNETPPHYLHEQIAQRSLPGVGFNRVSSSCLEHNAQWRDCIIKGQSKVLFTNRCVLYRSASREKAAATTRPRSRLKMSVKINEATHTSWKKAGATIRGKPVRQNQWISSLTRSSRSAFHSTHRSLNWASMACRFTTMMTANAAWNTRKTFFLSDILTDMHFISHQEYSSHVMHTFPVRASSQMLMGLVKMKDLQMSSGALNSRN